jgi:hypothetical protein
MFDKEGVVAPRKQSKMFQSPRRDIMTTGHYNPAGTTHGTGIAPRVGTEKLSSKQVVPTKSGAYTCDEFIYGG